MSEGAGGMVLGSILLADAIAPTLSNPQDGTPTSDGATGASVDSNEGNGTLYWAVLTDGGTCTNAQLKAGSGGNIVAGKAGNQAVSSSGTQTIPNITGLSAGTNYEIVWLQRDAAGNDSGQAATGLTTTGGSIPVALDVASALAITNSGAAVTSNAITVGNNANRCLVAICTSDIDTRTVSSVAYATGSGGTWAFVGRMTNSDKTIEIWTSLAPATGSTTVTSTWSAVTTSDNAIEVLSLYNVNQATPANNFNSTGSNTVTLAVTAGGVNDMAVVGLLANGSPGVITAGTEDANGTSGSVHRDGHNGGGASSNTVAWTTASVGRGIAGCNMKAA